MGVLKQVEESQATDTDVGKATTNTTDALKLKTDQSYPISNTCTLTERIQAANKIKIMQV